MFEPMESLNINMQGAKDPAILHFGRLFSMTEDLIEDGDPRDLPNLKSKSFP
jgi:hypothetical protein